MPQIFIPESDNAEAYTQAGERVFQFFRRHSDDAYSSPTLMQMAAQCVNQKAPYIIVEETPTRIDRLTETKAGGVRAAAVILSDGRVLLATRERHRRQGLGRMMLEVIQHNVFADDLTLQFWVATRNLDALRFLLAGGLEIMASTATTQCFGFETYGAERAWPR